ncbi:MAG: resolvase [Actinobacteria bacterium]|nr:resolvase [Actinomycetota bacterium]
MKVGYIRSEIIGDDFNTQKHSLKQAGCQMIFRDIIQGTQQKWRGLDDALTHLKKGDTLMVCQLDRIGRSFKHLMQMVIALDQKEVGFISLREKVDTSTQSGQQNIALFQSLLNFHRDITRERTIVGLSNARSKGRVGGRPRAFTDEKFKLVQKLRTQKMSVQAICKKLKISRPTYYRWVGSDKKTRITTG